MGQTSELKGLESIFCTKEGMKGYIDGRPRPLSTALGILFMDAARPVASSLNLRSLRRLLPYFSFPRQTTPWTGMVGRMKETNEFVGRIANGSGGTVGYSESGIALAPGKRKQGLGKEAAVALAIHAWLFKNLNFPVGNARVTHFTATASPTNPFSMGLINRLGATILDTPPQATAADRKLYGIEADQIDKVLESLVPDLHNQIIINDTTPNQFYESRQNL